MDINLDLMHNDRCASAFERIGWAFLFFLDFEITIRGYQFDILPNFIGWAVIAYSLTQILDLAHDVRALRNLALGMIFLSLFSFFKIELVALLNWSSIINAIAFVLVLIFVWRLCGLIMHMARSVDYTTLEKTAEHRREIYLGVEIGLIILGLFVVKVAIRFSPLFILVGIALKIVIVLLMMSLMRDTETMCRNNWTV